MTVRLEEIRTIASLDSAQFESAAQKIVAAGEKMQDAVGKAGDAIEQTDRKTKGTAQAFQRLVTDLDPAARMLQRFESGQKAINEAFDNGAISGKRQAELMGLLRERYGQAAPEIGRVTSAVAGNSSALALLSTAAGNAESRFKGTVRTLGDMRGTLELMGPATGSAGRALGTLAALAGNVGDAFGILSTILARHPLLVIGTALVAAGGAFLYLRDSAISATEAIESYAKAMEKSQALTQSSEEQSRRAAETKIAEARAEDQGALALNRRLLAEQEIGRLRAQSTYDRLTAQRAQGTEGLDEGIERAGSTLEGIAAAATATADRIAALEAQLKKLDGMRAAPVMSETAKGLIALEDALEKAHAPDLTADLKRRGDVIASLKQPMDLYAEAVREATISLRQGWIGPDEYARRLANLNTWLYQTDEAFARDRELIEEDAKAMKDLAEAQKQLLLDELAEDQKRLNDLREAATRVTSETTTATEKYAKEVDLLNTLLKQGFIDQEAYNRKIEQLNNQLYQSDPAFAAAREGAAKYAKDVERIVERTTDRLVDLGADALFDYLEGRQQNFWATMVTTGKRAFAQMAAEAVLRPILQPIVQQTVGAVPQAFGLQQQGTNPLSLLQTAGQVKDAGSFLSNPLGSLSNLFSPDNFIANAFPSLFGSGMTAGATLASSLTGPGGMMLGGGAQSALTMTAGPLAGLAPFLPVLAIALPLLLSSLFGGKKSVGPNANAILNFGDGRLSVGGLGADNGGDKEAARQMGDAVVKGFNQIVDRIGGRAMSVPGAGQSNQLEVGYFAEGNKFFGIVDGQKEEYGSAEEAVAGTLRRILKSAVIDGLSEDLREALNNSTAKTMEELGRQVDFAQNYQRDVAYSGTSQGSRAAQILGFRFAAEDKRIALNTQNNEYLRTAKELFGSEELAPGIDGTMQVTRYGQARGVVRSRIYAAMGLGADGQAIDRDSAAFKPLEGEAAAAAQARAELDELAKSLVDLGDSAAEAQAKADEAYQAWIAERREGFDKSTKTALLAAQGKGYLSELGGLEESRTQAIADATTLGADLAQVEALYGQLRLNALQKFSVQQLNEAEAYYRAEGELTSELQSQIDAARAAARATADLTASQAMGMLYAQDEARRVTEQVSANQVLLQTQVDLAASAREAARDYAQFRDQIEQTRFGLMVRTQTPTQAFSTLQGEFRRLLTLALQGDKTALGQIGQAGTAYYERASAYYGGGSGFAPVAEEIDNGLAAARQVAEQQRSLAEGQLSAAEQQVGILEQIRDRLTSSGNQVGGGEFETLVQAVQQFVGAKASLGLSESQIRSLPEWSYFEAQRREIVGRITDTSYLVNALYRYYGGRRTADAAGDTGAPEIVARLHALGVPGFAQGGTTGNVAFVHPREMLYTGPPARVFNPAETQVLMGGGAGQMAGLGELIAAVNRNTQVVAQSSVAVTSVLSEQAGEIADMAAGVRRMSVRS